MSRAPFHDVIPRRVRRVARALSGDRAGAAILEFAFVAPAFIALLTGVFYIALWFLTMQGLETAAQSAGRLLMTGQAQTSTVGSHTGMSAADFKTAICSGLTTTSAAGASVTIPPMLPPFMTCGQLTTNVVIEPAGTGYSNTILTPPTYNCYGSTCNSAGNSSAASNASGSALAGSQNSIVIVQLFYNWTTVAGLFGLNGGALTGTSGHQTLVSTAVVATENYSCAAGQATC